MDEKCWTSGDMLASVQLYYPLPNILGLFLWKMEKNTYLITSNDFWKYRKSILEENMEQTDSSNTS